MRADRFIGKTGEIGSIDSQCLACRHFVQSSGSCAAFPTIIPGDIYFNRVDHREPVTGDHGVHFEPLPGRRHPLEVAK